MFATFSASSRVTFLMNSSDGKLHTAEISEAMSLLRQAAHRHGEICLGNEGQAKQFFQSWGISNYWDSFVNDNIAEITFDENQLNKLMASTKPELINIYQEINEYILSLNENIKRGAKNEKDFMLCSHSGYSFNHSFGCSICGRKRN